SGKFGPYFEI
ncbi:unnamed protein product, partial [Rotaria sordida]